MGLLLSLLLLLLLTLSLLLLVVLLLLLVLLSSLLSLFLLLLLLLLAMSSLLFLGARVCSGVCAHARACMLRLASVCALYRFELGPKVAGGARTPPKQCTRSFSSQAYRCLPCSSYSAP